jgi:NADPH2:quinone reductase
VKAWRVHTFGEPRDVLQLEEVLEPTGADLEGMTMGLGGWEPMSAGREPFTDWVVLTMSHAALALPDVTTARGTYPVPVPRPYIVGQEGVGTVVDAAPGRRNMLGKRVAAVCIQPWGSLAPVSVGVSTIFEVPDGMSDVDAAGFLIPGHTAYHAAIRRGGVTAGETVVVLGAGGGVGSAMVQLSIAHGARVIAVVGGAEKVAFCESLGAEVVDHESVDVVEGVRALTDAQGVDVVLDPVQGEVAGRIRAVLRPDGRHVLCGHAGGLQGHEPDFYLYNHTLVGATLGSYPRDEMRRLTEETHAALVGLVADGRYRSAVTRCVAFDQVPDALNDLAARRTMGRVVVDVRN